MKLCFPCSYASLASQQSLVIAIQIKPPWPANKAIPVCLLIRVERSRYSELEKFRESARATRTIYLLLAASFIVRELGIGKIARIEGGVLLDKCRFKIMLEINGDLLQWF